MKIVALVMPHKTRSFDSIRKERGCIKLNESVNYYAKVLSAIGIALYQGNTLNVSGASINCQFSFPTSVFVCVCFFSFSIELK